MAGEIGSWLSGPEPLGPKSGYPGEQLGLPQAGPGSLARMGRRLGALVVDWLIAYGLAGPLVRSSYRAGRLYQQASLVRPPSVS